MFRPKPYVKRQSVFFLWPKALFSPGILIMKRAKVLEMGLICDIEIFENTRNGWKCAFLIANSKQTKKSKSLDCLNYIFNFLKVLWQKKSIFTIWKCSFLTNVFKKPKPSKNKSDAKNGNNKKHLNTIYSCIFLQNILPFDVDLFSPCFDMESPYNECWEEFAWKELTIF